MTAAVARWLALGADALPPDEHWLAPGESATLAAMRFTKRRNEFLLRRLVAKRAVALATGRPTDPATLAGIEARNAASGAPYVCAGPAGGHEPPPRDRVRLDPQQTHGDTADVGVPHDRGLGAAPLPPALQRSRIGVGDGPGR